YVEAKTDPEVRRLLQKLGTEVGRNMIGENVWVSIMARKIDDHRSAGHPVVVTGLRFPNEPQMIRELGGRTVWIDRPSLAAGAAAAHVSENSGSESALGARIIYAGTLEGLYEPAGILVCHCISSLTRREHTWHPLSSPPATSTPALPPPSSSPAAEGTRTSRR